jgi:hypothetical protein
MCKPWKVNGIGPESTESEKFKDHSNRIKEKDYGYL